MRALFCTISLLAVAAGSSAWAETGKGDVIIDARLRYEFVDQAGFTNDADAVTLRTRLGYETPAFHGWKGLIEAENVTALVEDFNSSTNGKTAYPLVTDPETTELNRLQVSWTGASGDVTVGRQRIILNNSRFVGTAGFRQNEQTFDAVKGSWKPVKDVTLTYAYVDKVRRIFGDDHPQGEWDSNSHLAQVDAKTPVGQLSVYGHWLEFDNAQTQSVQEAGARLTGSQPVSAGPLAMTYELEYARQKDFGGNPASFELDYLAVALGLKKDAHSIALGLEKLDGNGARGFATPLASLHLFQGWADVFLTTPGAGVRDLNLRAATQMQGPHGKPVKLQMALHDFAEADGDSDYGQEIDAAVSTPLTKYLTAELKAASFASDAAAFADRSKIWLTLEFKF